MTTAEVFIEAEERLIRLRKTMQEDPKRIQFVLCTFFGTPLVLVCVSLEEHEIKPGGPDSMILFVTAHPVLMESFRGVGADGSQIPFDLVDMNGNKPGSSNKAEGEEASGRKRLC